MALSMVRVRGALPLIVLVGGAGGNEMERVVMVMMWMPVRFLYHVNTLEQRLIEELVWCLN